ncbi:hypothetical protein J6590_103306 [Homalodisca vitripennis]|nr:hypothetical protein J6590_103306 [Homalodisca vitripennis]
MFKKVIKKFPFVGQDEQGHDVPNTLAVCGKCNLVITEGEGSLLDRIHIRHNTLAGAMSFDITTDSWNSTQQ